MWSLIINTVVRSSSHSAPTYLSKEHGCTWDYGYTCIDTQNLCNNSKLKKKHAQLNVRKQYHLPRTESPIDMCNNYDDSGGFYEVEETKPT